MTIATELKRVVQVGTGATNTFYFNAPVKDLDGLAVYTYDTSSATQTLQVRGGSATYDYTIAINPSTEFATITLNNVLPTTHRIIVLRDVAITQEVDYVEGDPFPAETHEGALDKLTLIATQLQEQSDRALKVLESSATVGLTVDELVADKSLIVRADGSGVRMGPDITEISNAATNAATAQAAATSANSAATTASNAAVTAVNAQNSIQLPTIAAAYAGFYVRVRADLAGYEFISPPQDNATFYGFKIVGSTLKLDKSVIGASDTFDVNDYRDYQIASQGMTMAVNSSGHLIVTFP
jgi:hypothetical protein